ncbi:MAG: hypothetical protein NC321_01120 [Clostridium sp.]|nr:hypothetical protein [Clostridium sp.]
MQKGFFKKKVAMCAAMTLIGCMLLGTTAMAADPSYSFSVKKGEYGYSGSGKKTKSGQTFKIDVKKYDADGYFFICPLEGNKQVGTDVTVTGTGTYDNGTYYETAYTGHTYQLMGFYDDLQSPVSSKCSCSGTWTP